MAHGSARPVAADMQIPGECSMRVGAFVRSCKPDHDEGAQCVKSTG
jgi:hypothetical protein